MLVHCFLFRNLHYCGGGRFWGSSCRWPDPGRGGSSQLMVLLYSRTLGRHRDTRGPFPLLGHANRPTRQNRLLWHRPGRRWRGDTKTQLALVLLFLAACYLKGNQHTPYWSYGSKKIKLNKWLKSISRVYLELLVKYYSWNWARTPIKTHKGGEKWPLFVNK